MCALCALDHLEDVQFLYGNAVYRVSQLLGSGEWRIKRKVTFDILSLYELLVMFFWPFFSRAIC